jgi:F-type H+-transporting ATPase subunit epsilon
MHTEIQLKLVTPAKTLFDQPVRSVVLPTESGEITVLPDHAPLVTILFPGELIVKTATEEFPLAVAGGVVEVFDNTLVVLADSAEHPTEIDIAAAEKRAEELAKELETQATMDITTYTTLQHNLERERARLSTAKKWRK